MTPKRDIILLTLLSIIVGLLPIPVYFLSIHSAILDVDIAALPSRNMSLFEQQAQVFAGLVVKSIYMMLSLFTILALIGQKSLYIQALLWGQIAFLTGETFCAINFYVFKHESVFSEYLHSYGMVLAFSFTLFAFFEGFELRFTRRVRARLAKEIRGIILFLLPIFVCLSFIPILSPIRTDAYTTSLFGFPYSYTRIEFYEKYEHQTLPVLAMILFILAFLSLLRKADRPISFLTKALFCSGLGALGFSFFRVVLHALFVNNLVWFEFWEEITELMFISIIGFILWRYRKIFLPKTQLLENFGIK